MGGEDPCKGKVRYPTGSAARRALTDIRKYGDHRVKEGRDTPTKPRREYPCDHCGGHHLTSKEDSW